MSIDDELKYRTLMEAAPDAIFFLDMQSGKIVDVNDRALELLGYDRSEIAGEPVQALHPTEDMEQYVGKFAESVGEGSVHFSRFDDGTQACLVDESGRRIPVDIHARVAETDQGPYVFGIARDISAIREYEQEIEQLAGELAVVNRLVRHDIRNDMAVIRGLLGELEDADDDERGAIVDRLLRQSDAVVELTETVKDYVEVLEEDADIELEPVHVDSIVEREARSARQGHGDMEITLEGIPTGPVLANSLLGSVFRNLFHNAVQHNDKDVARVTVSGEERPETVVIRVADNGPGIDESQREQIFGKGQKGLDSAGTGIGLFLVGKLVEKFDGEISVRDNEPEGTVFEVELRKA
ncbi:ATP-binding protein [Haloglomus halophilum]|jgi:PAS domain S-box-containing protein|uniref:ATP-binding protein n=1 Tax=Haloglomus halophilum TaxID=2962672 RepID=UPI0020C99CCF|nr:PAS domain-containing sensor histidine kinase [Haloglomus halophilum]